MLVVLMLTLTLAAPAQADPALEAAFGAAQTAFARAQPALDAGTLGVDLGAYGAALHGRAFNSAYWGQELTLLVEQRATETGSCTRYAAFVRMPPADGAITLVLCPEFFTAGADGLRALTVLHEMVHVVAGPDECRAMAFAAEVEWLAVGRYTPVDAYWRANGCDSSAFRLP